MSTATPRQHDQEPIRGGQEEETPTSHKGPRSTPKRCPPAAGAACAARVGGRARKKQQPNSLRAAADPPLFLEPSARERANARGRRGDTKEGEGAACDMSPRPQGSSSEASERRTRRRRRRRRGGLGARVARSGPHTVVEPVVSRSNSSGATPRRRAGRGRAAGRDPAARPRLTFPR